MSKIDELEAWRLTVSDLQALPNQATVRFDLAYPDYKAVLAYPPEQRRKQLAALMRHAYKALIKCLPKLPFTKSGSHFRPTGVRMRLPVALLPALTHEEAIASIQLEEIEHMVRVEPVIEATFWSIKARFAIQIENETGGRQAYEDRILLLKALDEADAQGQLLPTFEEYATPCLNSAGRLVRWKFEKFLDAYQVGAWPLDSCKSDKWLEVFSEIKKRKLTRDSQWMVSPTDLTS